MSNAAKQYLVADVVVEATKSEGGGFYDITILQTGEKGRYLAEVFEMIAKPYISVSEDPAKASFVEDCGGCDMCKNLENGGGDR